MKKILLASVAGAGLLASCGGDITVTIPGYFGAPQTSSAALTRVSSYSTNYQLSSDVLDQNGNTLKQGTSIICDNVTTEITGGVDFTGDLNKLGLQLKGVTSKDYDNLGTNDVNRGGITSGTVQVNISVPKGLAPLSLGAQAIVVNPRTVDIKGYTYLRAQGLDTQGRATNIIESAAIPVVDCTAG
ncbi:hypothetical protein [Deinococcus wulumuqiensis]|uniref:hypothetical protein n=1 Tax=Deinococcus wulumuqiensis TaxID=980427 RepID=UPI00242BCEBD|nr:hypothetical protein [Deinococcus wulumuqiensis]